MKKFLSRVHSAYDAPSPADARETRSIFKPRMRRPNFLASVVVNTIRALALIVLILMLAGAGAVVGIARAYVDTAPSLDLTLIDDQAQTSFIYDAQGNLITDYKGTEDRVMVSISQMPMRLRNAFVAVEDARFYTHNGIDVKRIIGAFVKNFVSGSQQGGSTITQQLIKNTILSSEQSYKRKIQEAYLAMQLETQYSKEQILESYLNTIYLGENYYGVYTAARGYFGKELYQLSLRECAMLAGLCTNPYYYNPRRNYYTRTSETTDYAAITNTRTDYALRMMYENQFITYEEYVAALEPSTATVLRQSPDAGSTYNYIYYVEYAVNDVVQTLLKLNNLENTSYNRNLMENELRTGGYHVYLCLDTEIQKTVEDTLYNYQSYPSLRDPADKIYRARNADGTYDEILQPQAAAVVLDYRTGELKAIVGGRTQPTRRKTLNRASDMNMPVGSSIKPISVYAPAIEISRLGGSAVVYNMPLPIKGYLDSNRRPTWPKNYGGSSYRGPETLRTALVKSDNTAAAYALMNYVGTQNSANILRALGVSDKHINETPFGLALGSSGISPVEMAVAFGVLGNGGVYQSPITFLGIADSSGNVIYDSACQPDQLSGVQPRDGLPDGGYDEGAVMQRHGHQGQDQRPDRGGQDGHQLRPEGRVLCRHDGLVLRHGVDRPRQLQGIVLQDHGRQQRRGPVANLHEPDSQAEGAVQPRYPGGLSLRLRAGARDHLRRKRPAGHRRLPQGRQRLQGVHRLLAARGRAHHLLPDAPRGIAMHGIGRAGHAVLPLGADGGHHHPAAGTPAV